ncbi:MAG: radical SAM protein [Candidatus Dormibacteria bacterium]
MAAALRPLLSDQSGEMVVAPPGWEAIGQSGRRWVDIESWIPMPQGTTLMHLPHRLGLARRPGGEVRAVAGSHPLPVAAVLPVGYLRLLLPPHRPEPLAQTLPLYGYTAVADRDGEVVVAAARTDDYPPWTGRRPRRAELAAAVAALQRELPRNPVVAQLSVCALEHNCLTAQNTFLGRHEGALPTSAACNADCLGCISLQTDSGAPTPQPRMRRAPAARELIEVGHSHLVRCEAAGVPGMVSFGQGCEGEPLLRERVLVPVTEELRRHHPRATIHVNTNASRPEALRRLVEAGVNSCRISVFSFRQDLFAAYYRPRGYGIEQVVHSARLAAALGAQVTVNLLTFPGVTDSPSEVGLTIEVLRELSVDQLQLRTLNGDPAWILDRLPELEPGLGMGELVSQLTRGLPGLAVGNFTRPVGGVAAGLC